tara:strand:- start:2159 stop:2473 length:315 start_codon:yes stop_codon:yes gene_type:complete
MKANSNATNSDNYKVVITPDNVTMDCTDELMECMSDKSNEECVDEYNECVIPKVDEGEIISELLTLTSLLDGKMERLITSNSSGITSKKIIIEYDIKERDQGSS